MKPKILPIIPGIVMELGFSALSSCSAFAPGIQAVGPRMTLGLAAQWGHLVDSSASWGSLHPCSSLSPGPLACCFAPLSPLCSVADTSLSQRCSQAGGSSEKSSESDVGRRGLGGEQSGPRLRSLALPGPAGNLRSTACVCQRLEVGLPSKGRNELAGKTEGRGLLSTPGQGTQASASTEPSHQP